MLMPLWERFIIALVASLLLSFITKRSGVLNTRGVVSAFVIGIVIGTFGDTSWLLILLVFLISSFAATKRNFRRKKEMGVQEGKKGERGWKNAWSAGLMPVVVAVFAFLDTPLLPREVSGIVFVAAIAAAASDTFASEMGMLFPNPVLITNPRKRVPIGTNGGITPMGTLWSFLASAHIGIWAYILLTRFSDTLPPPAYPTSALWMEFAIIMGFVGCQIDSLLGSLYENRGKLSKHAVNLISTGLATLITWMVVMWTI
ncbi:MAG: DUF92 domain-containing protein [Thermoplasmata archaeon]|nr:DUF92 domain-containing protein [Thermoplasmata archaeon]